MQIDFSPVRSMQKSEIKAKILDEHLRIPTICIKLDESMNWYLKDKFSDLIKNFHIFLIDTNIFF